MSDQEPHPDRLLTAEQVKHWIEAAELLIKYDEVERAEALLLQLPAYHRDHPIAAIEALQYEIKRAKITPHAYMDSDFDASVSVDQSRANIEHLLRGKILVKEMEHLKDTKPHIVDLGPGEYWVPIGLASMGFSFSYKPIFMDQKAYKAAAPLIQHLIEEPNLGSPTIFVAHEIIEHLPSVMDIAIEAARYLGKPDYVHLSTPLYTFDSRYKEWKKKGGLPHLRAYTPQEFILEAQKLFPGYNWEWRTDLVQSLRGYRVGGPILEGWK